MVPVAVPTAEIASPFVVTANDGARRGSWYGGNGAAGTDSAQPRAIHQSPHGAARSIQPTPTGRRALISVHQPGQIHLTNNDI